ncbi:MAG TPA: HAMP domain-containing sensor histidine kinase [Isosphaeraceae bacterium]|jgi:signal transduction histidine kinase|nr:HAMP domain-containing sensor histidine kinase [Isosphaeraceae bacterium]
MANLWPGTVSEAQLKTRGEPRAAVADASAGPATALVEPSSPATARGPVHPAADLEPEVTRRLRAQYAEVSQLAGGLAHEIRNPLSTVSLNLDLLAEDFQHPETPRDRRVLQRVERLQHEVLRLRDILESFLRFARVQPLRLESINLNAIVEELCDFYEPTAATKGVVIRTYLAPDLPSTAIDADLLKQALLNLILNAEHAMPSGGELILKTHHDGPWVVLDVIDTGVGMTEEVRARIFDAFFSTRPAGSGLGLPTARKIVEAHGGTLTVQSEPGKGSQFTLRLPGSEAGSPRQEPLSWDVSPPTRPS